MALCEFPKAKVFLSPRCKRVRGVRVNNSNSYLEPNFIAAIEGKAIYMNTSCGDACYSTYTETHVEFNTNSLNAIDRIKLKSVMAWSRG